MESITPYNLVTIIGIYSLINPAIVIPFIYFILKKANRKSEFDWIHLEYNYSLLFSIAGANTWAVATLCLPILNIIPWSYLCFKLSKRFGLSNLFALVLIAFPILGFPMLAFGPDKYQGRG